MSFGLPDIFGRLLESLKRS